MYRDTVKKADIEAKITGAVDELKEKVNSICNAFLDVLSSRSSAHLQNIITAHVSKTPPDLEGGLKIISQLKGMDPATYTWLQTDEY
jgi:elongator complex protein 1